MYLGIYNASQTQRSHDGFQKGKLMSIEASLHGLKQPGGGGGAQPPGPSTPPFEKHNARVMGVKKNHMLQSNPARLKDAGGRRGRSPPICKQCSHDGFRKHCFEASLHGSKKRRGWSFLLPCLFLSLTASIILRHSNIIQHS